MEAETRGVGRRVVDEVRLMNGLRDDLASAMQDRTAHRLRLRTSFEAHQSTLTLIEGEIATIGSQVLSSSEALRQANFLLEKLSVSAVHLQKTSEIFDSQLSKTNRKLEQDQKCFNEIRKQLDSYKDSFRLVEQAEATKVAVVEIQAIKTSKQALERELEECRSQTNELEQEKERLEPELERQRASLVAAAEAHRLHQTRNKELLEELHRFKEEYIGLQQRQKSLEENFSRLQAEKLEFEKNASELNEKTDAEVCTAQTALSEATLRLHETASDIEAKQNELAKIVDQRKQLDAEMVETTSRMYSSISKMNELRDRDNEISESRSTVEKDIKARRHELARLKSESSIIEESSEAKAKLKTLRQEITKLETKYHENAQKEILLTEKCNILRQEACQAQARIEQSILKKKTMSDLVTAKKSELHSLESLVSEITRGSKRLAEVNKQVTEAQESATVWETNVEETGVLLREKHEAVELLKLRKEELRDMQHVEEERLAGLEKQIKEVREQIKEAEERAKTAKEEVQTVDPNADDTDIIELEAKLEADLDSFKKDLEARYQATVETLRVECKARYQSFLTRSIESEKERLQAEFSIQEKELEAEVLSVADMRLQAGQKKTHLEAEHANLNFVM
ncbi:putative myosin heavy chain [Toxoplasma gondii TgCatPRC2]|uniref:Uncharacterized protein n=3 Tax=Toxoplasma gondii TaxID=5811 RepID=S8EWF6_TOXGM|nr:hypothetical protein TGME49_264805 [Toxoplasma gondii ME49]EPT27781.1 hypothetical protein TGME49_264805 [Toxoplasma gondii ME49]KYF45354.1 putative kinesin K39 [Toxoplasma gondii ARI]KYK64791.1 putative myosin heavy chain [Toxoplasma gondii TgCatPRC2]|eukprot:XP_018636321.1 hypothetical protein TGME49_264805 [Toxoplasma gondii ME49]